MKRYPELRVRLGDSCEICLYQISILHLAGDVCAPNIGSNDIDTLDHRPEDGGVDLSLCRESDNEDGTAGTEIVNRLLVRGALYTSGLCGYHNASITLRKQNSR